MSPTPLQSLSRYAKVSVVGVIRSPPRQTPPRNEAELTFDHWCCLANRQLNINPAPESSYSYNRHTH